MDLHRILNDPVSVTQEVSTTETSPVVVESKLRVGKWAEDEERYASALVKHFVAGALPIATGTSLRSFLASKLHCSAMRISTKLSMDTLGDMTIPKKLGQKRFFPMEGLPEIQRQRVASELRYLEMTFLRKENLPCNATKMVPDMAATEAWSTTGSITSSDDETDGPMRVGSWSEEEQIYACALIDAFLHGRVNATEGTTLRAFLADRLCCNPMRVSKKLATGKMATTTVPKRLGSATYHRQAPRGEFGEISRMEYQLDQLKFKCFSTASSSRYPHNTPSRHQVVYTPTAHQTQPQSMAVHRAHRNVLSPVHSGMKRKMLPSLAPPSSFYLPSLPSVMHKQPRLALPSVTAIAFQ